MTLAAAVSLGVTIILGGFFFLMAVETHQLLNGGEPITALTRTVIIAWPGQALTIAGVILFLVGLFFAHFIWDAGLL